MDVLKLSSPFLVKFQSIELTHNYFKIIGNGLNKITKSK